MRIINKNITLKQQLIIFTPDGLICLFCCVECNLFFFPLNAYRVFTQIKDIFFFNLRVMNNSEVNIKMDTCSVKPHSDEINSNLKGD